jgi:hypothetical protein
MLHCLRLVWLTAQHAHYSPTCEAVDMLVMVKNNACASPSHVLPAPVESDQMMGTLACSRGAVVSV